MIEGNFSPETVIEIVFDGSLTIPATYNLNGQLLAKIPIVTPKAHLRVQLKTVFGEFSNSLYLDYRVHITNATLLTKIVYQNLVG